MFKELCLEFQDFLEEGDLNKVMGICIVKYII